MLTEYTDVSDNLSKKLTLMEQLAEIGYWEFDVQKHQFRISSELKRIIGPLPQTLKLKKFISASGYKKFIKALGNLMHHDEKLSLEVKIVKPDKSFAYCLLKADWMCKQHKNIILGTLQDVTEFFNVKKQLINARNEAEKLNREKSFFLAQASHDLRQPLYALKLYLSLLQPKHFSKRQNMLWENINKSADSLKYLLENVLDLSKLDYGGTKTAKTYFNVGMLLSDLGREFKHVANCNDLTLEYQICNCVVYSDAFLIERILRNLLSNAFKFATKKVSMLCYEHKKYVVVEVKDDGKGISPQDKKYIFEAFYRGKDVADKQNDGMGLGLAIVKRIAAALHIKISVSSQLNKGTSFKVFLPQNKK